MGAPDPVDALRFNLYVGAFGHQPAVAPQRHRSLATLEHKLVLCHDPHALAVDLCINSEGGARVRNSGARRAWCRVQILFGQAHNDGATSIVPGEEKQNVRTIRYCAP